jgi:TonB family protein
MGNFEQTDAYNMNRIIFIVGLIVITSNLFAQERNSDKDIYPLPKGGMAKFRAKIYNNLKYPKDALEQGIEGTVYVKFMVDENGNVPKDSISVIHSLFPSLDKEAIRLISKSPKWFPDINENGQPIKCWLYNPIDFKIENYK